MSELKLRPPKAFARERGGLGACGLAEGETFDGCGHATFVVGESFVPAVGFEFGDAVGHNDRDSGEVEHFQIIVIVADGQNFIALEAAMFGPFGEGSAFGAVRRKNVNHGEVGRLVESDRKRVACGEIGVAKNGFGGTHFRDGAGEHDLNGVLDDCIFERRNDADVFEIAFVVGVAAGIFFAKRFKHELIGDGAIEDDGCAFAPGFCGFENVTGNFFVEQMAEMSFAVGGADEGAVVDDHGDGAVELVGDGHGEIVAAASDEGDFDAAACGFGDGGAVGVGELPAAVEQSAVNVESDEADRHVFYSTVKRAGNSPVRRGSSKLGIVWVHPGCFCKSGKYKT
jgi:hypothetical protein